MNVVVQELLEVLVLEVIVQSGEEGVLCVYNLLRDSHIVSYHWNRWLDNAI